MVMVVRMVVRMIMRVIVRVIVRVRTVVVPVRRDRLSGRRDSRGLEGALGRPVDLAQRNTLFAGEPGTIFEFRREQALLALPPAELAPNRAPRRLDRVFASRAFRSLD